MIESDLEKLGIKYFLKDFDIKILDFTNLLQSQSIEFFKPKKTFPFLNIIDIKKFSEVDKIFDKPGFVIDYIGQFSLKSILVFNIVKKKMCKIVVIDQGPVPWGIKRYENSVVRKIIKSFFNLTLFKELLFSVLRKILLKFLPNQDADIALVIGHLWKSNFRYNNAKNKNDKPT